MKTVASSVMKRKKEESQIDLTPMLDVVFILLIFFVVTASFLKESTLPIRGQDPNNNPPPPDEEQKQNAMIQISAEDRIFLNNEPVDLFAMRPRLASIRAENPDASVIIRPNKQSKAETLVVIMNAAREAGAANIQIAQ